MAQTPERVEITGTRILRPELQSSSPVVSLPAAELLKAQDITVEMALNVLPQVNPNGTSTSNNPPNGGQASLDLRGLGSNRNLVLIDGRRAMVSASNQTVDLNTIPFSLIDGIDVITGGAGAVYGADAVAGVVNIRLKRNFQGLDLRAGYADAPRTKDAMEKSFTLTTGGNFGDGRGNAVLAFDVAQREGLIKSQRSFAAVATATTSYFPEGTYRPTSNNAPSQAAVNTLFGQSSYGGVAAGTVPNTAALTFNSDGSLIYPGIFNSPRDVVNWRYPVDTGVNTNIFPDVYSYNFDAVNILVLPLKRDTVMGKVRFQVSDSTEVFSQYSHTRYTSSTALAPTPVPTVVVAAPDVATATQASSALVTPGRNVSSQLIVPVTNPFIPADLKALLNSRTGDNPAIVGSGATEPFLMRWRTLGAGLRQSNYENLVSQYLIGAKGGFGKSDWSWEASLSEGRTKILQGQTGNIDTNRLLGVLAAADGGRSICEGGVNPFGRQTLSAACSNYLEVSNTLTREFTQRVGQAFVNGDVGKLPAGPVSVVAGLESRTFKYTLDPGSAAGPISGFNVQSAAAGRNQFTDFFGEVQLPLARKAPMAQSLDLSLAARSSQSKATNLIDGSSTGSKRNSTYALNLTWQPSTDLRGRASLQKAVRAPNFGELFDGGGSSPQYFDPCSVTSVGRTSGANAAQLRALCRDTGTANGGAGLGSAVDTYVQTPGTQAQILVGGNTQLAPETGNSLTLGLVWVPAGASMKGLSASVDYYRIDIKNAINVPDTNELVADCYNYYGRNPSYSATYSSCAGIVRANDILQVLDPTSADGTFAGTNGGRTTTSGIDVQLGWVGNVGPGRLDVRANLNYLLSYKNQNATYLPMQEYKGTIPYFGAGLGQAFPKIKGVVSAGYKFGAYSVDARLRYIDGMRNRMSVMFPGEVFTGTPATTYLDIGAGWDFMKGGSIRLGLNNATDQKPRTYAPNVQSGTDPSTYDVVGRRVFVVANFKFD